MICAYTGFDRDKQHGPAVTNRRGYTICQGCADSMDEAERASDLLYEKLNERTIADIRSRELQRKAFC